MSLNWKHACLDSLDHRGDVGKRSVCENRHSGGRHCVVAAESVAPRAGPGVQQAGTAFKTRLRANEAEGIPAGEADALRILASREEADWLLSSALNVMLRPLG